MRMVLLRRAEQFVGLSGRADDGVKAPLLIWRLFGQLQKSFLVRCFTQETKSGPAARR